MDNRVQALTADSLTPLVRRALADPTAAVASWQVEAITGGWGGAMGGTAVYRVAGQTERGIAWSLVLKILYERPGETEESPYYWKREYELYRSGLLDQLPDSGLTPPTIYALAEYPESCWLWLAAIDDDERAWTLDDYHSVSRRLGRFNGAYLTGLPIPDAPWLSVNWHCRITPPLAETFERLDEYLQQPLIQRALPLAEKDAILAIWREVDRFCEALADLPQTLCHMDAFQRNILHSNGKTILIDWALAGRSAIGEDLVTMVALPLYFGDEMPVSRADVLDRAVFAGYVAGLRDVGWTGDPQLARLGYVCAMTLRGLAGVKQDIGLLIDERNFPRLLRGSDLDQIEAIADRYAAVRRFRLLKMADETRQLLAR